MNRLIGRGRLAALGIIMVIVAGIYAVALYKLQIIDGAEYYESSRNNVITKVTVEASRGDILDRYGRVLVTSEECYNVKINTDRFFEAEDPNALILELLQIVESCGDTYIDSLPITAEAPFEFTEMTALQRTLLDGYIANAELDVDADGNEKEATAVDVMAWCRERYVIDNNYTSEQTRRVAGIRYELNLRHIVPTSDYIFVNDASQKLIATLLEHDFPGIEVVISYNRVYKTNYAAHVLGYIGPLTGDDIKEYENKGYSRNSMIGKDGAELAFEEYLHGTEGEAQITTNASGTIIDTVYLTEPQGGSHVYLTIDSELEARAEEALRNYIEPENVERAEKLELAEMYGWYTEDVEDLIPGGAVAVIDIKSGEPLALASYPSYDPATVLEDYAELLEDPDAPLFNRTLMGTYSPGSVFKPVTAIASLNEKIIDTDTVIYDEGLFTKYQYAGYAPSCWIWGKGSHGECNVTRAITVSCNYFFFSCGDLLGIDKLAAYAKQFGLGSTTGIELVETPGIVASQEYKQWLIDTEQTTEERWFIGDTLQASIGQSYHQFTPLQLAIYCSTIANQGNRYSASILKSVRSGDYANETYKRRSIMLDQVGNPEVGDGTVPYGYFEAVWDGMYAVANDIEGTAQETFRNYPVKVAAKTGTAQRGDNVTNDAVFMCFAPYDDPEVAVAVIVERGSAGSYVASIARDVLDCYFAFKNSTATVDTEQTLLK